MQKLAQYGMPRRKFEAVPARLQGLACDGSTEIKGSHFSDTAFNLYTVSTRKQLSGDAEGAAFFLTQQEPQFEKSVGEHPAKGIPASTDNPETGDTRDLASAPDDSARHDRDTEIN